MFAPLLLTLLAVLSAAVVAYGTHPAWARFPHGLEIIMLSRRLQWPLVTLSLILCLALLALIIAGKRRAWWLIGLGPILALFVHRFATDPSAALAVEAPTFVSVDQATFLADDDYVVGLVFEGTPYAYPYSALFVTPVVLHSDHDKRIILMWSAYANRAVASTVKRELKGRDLEIVSTPANALLVYDKRLGTFINGLKGQTTAGSKPTGFVSAIPTDKMRWAQWRAAHDSTKVMVPAAVPRGARQPPRGPILPSQPMPGAAPAAGDATLRVTVVGASRPSAIASDGLKASPVHLTADGVPVMAFRDPKGGVRAFDRRVDDLAPRFELNRDPKRPAALFVDVDTNTGWDARGVAVEGKKEFRGKRLAPVPADDDLYWGVMKFWYPQLELTATAKP